MDYEKLRSVIQRSGLKQGYIAAQVGITDHAMHDRITGKVPFRMPEVVAFCKALKLTRKQAVDIFFDGM